MNSFFGSYVNCFRKYGSLNGRSCRQEYVSFTVVNCILSLILSPIPVLSFLFGLFLIVPWLGVSVRRLHDLNKSGWFLLLPYPLLIIGGAVASTSTSQTIGVWLLLFSLLAMLVMTIWMLCFKGTTGENRFGTDPYPYPESTKVKKVTHTDDVMTRLQQAKKMMDEGLINEAEYELIRNKIIQDI